jgi:hypothetical protein
LPKFIVTLRIETEEETTTNDVEDFIKKFIDLTRGGDSFELIQVEKEISC